MPGPARRRTPRKAARKTAPASRAVLEHELAVHQEELRAQNEKLISAMQALEETRDRYVELYDFAPIGYLTLDTRGFVSEINLSGVAMLGRPRHQIVGLPILRLVAEHDRQTFLKYLSTCRMYRGGPWPVVELTIHAPAGTRVVQLTCRPRASDSRAPQFFTALIDVTEQRRLEVDRETARRQHADLARQMMSLQEHERQRIARDIHDDLGQQITGLRLKLEWLAGIVAGDPPLRTNVEGVQEVAQRLDRHVDFLLRHLRPAGLDDVGLVAALEQTVQEWSATFGIPAEFRANGVDGRRLPGDSDGHLYRIVQEALNNVHKHASARHVLVTLDRHGPHLTLTVRDDGTGIDEVRAASVGARRGLGLIGMHERAALIGARFEIVSTPGRGTTVVVEMT
jgi:PAS domain S-box-containing protein